MCYPYISYKQQLNLLVKMSYKKRALLVIATIVIIILIFSHKLYGYFELTFDKLAAVYQSSPHLSSPVTPNKKESNDHSLTNIAADQNSQSFSASSSPHKANKVTVNRCRIPELVNITTQRQKYTKNDGSIDYRVSKNYYQLETNLGKGYEPFLEELNLKLNAAFQHIENRLDIRLNKKIKLQIVFLTSRTEFENYLNALGAPPRGYQGMYQSYNNLAVVEFVNHKQAINAAIHEAIHAFNYAYFGYSLRFLNEGMAQYLSAISSNGSIATFNFSWLKHQRYPHQISTLLFSELDWHGNNNHELYQNSNALFHFLMTNAQGRALVQQILKLEMKEPCSVLTQGVIEELLFEHFPNHQQEFDYWFENSLNSFLSEE